MEHNNQKDTALKPLLETMIMEEHSKAQTNVIIKWVKNDQQRFDALVHLFLHGEQLVTQRAGWPMSYVAIAHPHLVKKHIKKLIQNLRNPKLHNAVKRNTVRLLPHVAIPKPLQGELMDHCFRFIEDPKEAVAVKAFSMKILHHLSKQYPEILPEIKAIVISQMDHQTAAFKAAAKQFFINGE